MSNAATVSFGQFSQPITSGQWTRRKSAVVLNGVQVGEVISGTALLEDGQLCEPNTYFAVKLWFMHNGVPLGSKGYKPMRVRGTFGCVHDAMDFAAKHAES